MGGILDSIRQATRYADYYSMGMTPREFNRHEEYKHTATLFGSKVANSVRKKVRHEESLENAQLDYDFDNMDVYTNRRYHEDCKSWLDIITHFDMPIQIESINGKTRYHDGDFNYSSHESRIWRFRDLETKYNLDFSINEQELEEEQKEHLSGTSIHIKFLYAKVEDQQGYFIMNKSLRRFAKILFIDGYDYLDGWSSRINQLPVREGRDKNWRARRVRLKDNKGNLSKNDGIALLAMWHRAGFIIVGEKQQDHIIAYMSPNMYNYITKDDPTALDDSLKYSRNKSYDIDTEYKL